MKYPSQFNPSRLKASQIGFCLSALVLVSLFCLDVKPINAEPPRMNTQGQILKAETHQAVFISQSQSIPASVINAVRQDLSRWTKLPANQLKLVEAKPKTWKDGCLGLAKSDELCTQALVDGWRVVFSHHHHTWIYRTDGTGRVIRLEKANAKGGKS